MGGFATALITMSLCSMGLRGVTTEAIHIGNLCFVASIGLLISAQWEILRGNSFSYTVLSAYGMNARAWYHRPLTDTFAARSVLCWLRRSLDAFLRCAGSLRWRHPRVPQCIRVFLTRYVWPDYA
jgi:hypothetical protein